MKTTHIRKSISKYKTKNIKTTKTSNLHSQGNLSKSHIGGQINEYVDIMPYLPVYGILDPEGRYFNPLTGRAYSPSYAEWTQKVKWYDFPVYKDRHIFFNKIHYNQVVLVITSTGSGKTVLCPKMLLHYFDYKSKIVVTIPKTTIVEKAAQGAANMLDVTFGKEVGYIHGNDKTMHSHSYTKLLFMTEGILLAMMTSGDPDLNQYAGVIIDEAHERTTGIDLVLLLLKKLVMRRPSFKVIIMSATVSEKVFKDFFNVEGIKFDMFIPTDASTLYKITDVFETKHINKKDSMELMMSKLKELVNNTSGGHIITFVTSKAEADKVCKELKDDLDKNKDRPICIEMYSGVKKHNKDIIDMKPEQLYKLGYGRKIIAATNAVESSMTVDNTEYVIDSGLAYVVNFDPVKNAIVRGRSYATQANIKQRCGRTGRTNPGQCIRLYSKGQWTHLDDFPEPDIQTENFSSNLLDIVGMKLTGNLKNGLALVQELISPPHPPFLKHAIYNIYYLNLLYKDGYLTPLGYAVRKFKRLEPEVAIMVLAGFALDCAEEVSIIAAMLQEGNVSNWIIEPTQFSKRTMNDYKNDIKALSNVYNNYGDHFTLLALYQEVFNNMYSDSERSKWCASHGVNWKSLQKVDKTIDDIYKLSNTLTYLPVMFDDPIPEPMGNLQSQYRTLTHIKDNYGSSQKYSQQYGGGNSKKKPANKPANKSAIKPVNKPVKVDKQQLEKATKMDFATTIFKKYYMPVDGFLPSRPNTKNLEDRILAAIYYGFHRNLGCHKGAGGKKYKSKNSEVDGSMKNSIFDILNLPPPEIVVYYQLELEDGDFGESSSYNVISKIDEDILAGFLQ